MKRAILYTLLLLNTLSAHAQNTGCEKVWKKVVSRDIVQRNVNGRSVTGIIEEGIKKGKIIAYDNYGDFNSPPRKMNRQQLDYIFSPFTDSQTTVNPVNGDEITKVIYHQFIPDSIYKFRITEEWTFNPTEGKINIEMLYLAPRKDVYGDDNVYRGSQTILRVRYKDFYQLMAKEDTALLQAFTSTYWQSYFAPDTGAHTTNTNTSVMLTADATMVIDMQEAEDTVIHYLRNEQDDTALSALIIEDAKNKRIAAWRPEYPYSTKEAPYINTKLSAKEIRQLTSSSMHMTTSVEPDGSNKMTLTSDNFSYEKVHKYQVVVNYSFDPPAGKISAVIKGAIPSLNIYDEDEGDTLKELKPLFLVRWDDLQPILTRYELYHPSHTFAMHIWDQYFLSDIKPVKANQ